MLGDNAVYLAKEIEKLDMYSGDRDHLISTVCNNKILFNAFYHAVGDMCEMMFRFQAGNDHGHNMYGYQGKFDSISSIARGFYLCANEETNYIEPYPKNFSKIADDLESMAIALDYEIKHNMNVTHSSRNKEYSRMEQVVC
jgi:hypothetical protein